MARPRSAAIKRGFQLLQRGGGQFGRGGDDALDFVGQFAVRFEQALFEFLKQTHDWNCGLFDADCRLRIADSPASCAVAAGARWRFGRWRSLRLSK